MERLEAPTPDELATLARLATAATNVGDGEWYGPDDEAVLFAVDWKEDAAFIAYCTPERIARLVEAASATPVHSPGTSFVCGMVSGHAIARHSIGALTQLTVDDEAHEYVAFLDYLKRQRAASPTSTETADAE